MSAIPKTKYTSQYIDNMSFDDDYKVSAVIPVEESGSALVRKQNDPLDGYKIADIDDTGYYGYLKADGSWYVMQESLGAYRYAKGDSDYTTAWTGRAGLSYDYFNVVF